MSIHSRSAPSRASVYSILIEPRKRATSSAVYDRSMPSQRSPSHSPAIRSNPFLPFSTGSSFMSSITILTALCTYMLTYVQGGRVDCPCSWYRARVRGPRCEAGGRGPAAFRRLLLPSFLSTRCVGLLLLSSPGTRSLGG